MSTEVEQWSGVIIQVIVTGLALWAYLARVKRIEDKVDELQKEVLKAAVESAKDHGVVKSELKELNIRVKALEERAIEDREQDKAERKPGRRGR